MWAQGSELQLMEAVQRALVASFRIPENDRDVVLDLYDPMRRLLPPGRSARQTAGRQLGHQGRPARLGNEPRFQDRRLVDAQ
jgi:hypothetical protein